MDSPRDDFDIMIDGLFDNIMDGERYKDPETRVNEARQVVDEHYNTRGRHLNGTQLERLATYIVKRDLWRRKGQKVDPSLEYDYLSDRQWEQRVDRREASFDMAGTFDTNKIDQVVKTRMGRIAMELKVGRIK